MLFHDMEARAQAPGFFFALRRGHGRRLVRRADERELRAAPVHRLDVLVAHEEVEHVHFREITPQIPFAARVDDARFEQVSRRLFEWQQLSVRDVCGDGRREMDLVEVFRCAPAEKREAQPLHEAHARR